MLTFKQFNEEIEATNRVGITSIPRMRPKEFLELTRALKKEYGGVLSAKDSTITEKIDGQAIRFGVDDKQRFFIETAQSGPQFDTVWFKSKDNRNAVKLFNKFSEWTELQDILKTVPGGVKVIGELLLIPGSKLDPTTGLRTFVTVSYDPNKLGSWATLVLFKAIAGTAGTKFDSAKLLADINKLSTNEVKFADPTMDIGDIDVTVVLDELIKTLEKYGDWKKLIASFKPSDWAAKKALYNEINKLQQKMAEVIGAKLTQSKFGPETEGAVITIGGKQFKVSNLRYIKQLKASWGPKKP